MEELDLREVFNIFWEKKVKIILIVIIFSLIGALYSIKLITPMYTSSTTMVLAQASESNNNGDSITDTDITLNSKLVSTYSVLIKSKTIIRQVLSNLHIDEDEQTVKKNVSVNSKSDTAMIEIAVKDKDAVNAYKIANEIASVFSEEVAKIYNINNVYIVDEAEVAEGPSNVNHIKNISIFAIIGIIVACLYAIISNMLDNTVKSVEDLENILQLPVLASISLCNVDKKGKIKNSKKEIITYKDPKSPVSEMFRTLRTNIQFMNSDIELKTLLVTSTLPSEGKSWITANLAVTFAQTGKKVIVVDADLRKGRQYNIFDVSPRPGLSNYLSGIYGEKNSQMNKIENVMQKTEIDNLYVIPAGNIPPNPSELLMSEKMLKFMEEIKKVCDIAIFDGTPNLLVTDSTILSRITDSTLIVTSYNSTKLENVDKVKKNIDIVRGKIAGITINKVPISNKEYNETYYYSPANVPVTKVDKNSKKKSDKDIDAENKITNNMNDETEKMHRISIIQNESKTVNSIMDISNITGNQINIDDTKKVIKNEEMNEIIDNENYEIAEEMEPKKKNTRTKKTTKKESSEILDKEVKKRTTKNKLKEDIDSEKINKKRNRND